MTTRTIYLTFGPVQEFLAQARRTRDLWTGSYLLSLLAGHALKRAQHEGGTIVLPHLDGNPLWEAILKGDSPGGVGDRVGSIPHIAEISAPAERAAEVARAAVSGWMDAWSKVAEGVAQHVRWLCPAWTTEMQVIWNRQVDNLWSSSWVLDKPEYSARRKTLRAFDLPDEPGEMCTCCGTREPLRAGDPRRQAIREFWGKVSERSGEIEVRSKGAERLCAICSIKRFLPATAVSAVGWKVPMGFPSTATMAGLGWRIGVLRAGGDRPELRVSVCKHIQALQAAGINFGTGDLNGFAGIAELINRWGTDETWARQFAGCNADWLSPDDLRREAHEAGARGVASMDELLRTLRELRSVASGTGIAPPSTSYALLMMDGDNMGRLLSTYQSYKQNISQALGEFSLVHVPEIVESSEAHGRLIYSGGDDVLALLPAETALDVASRLYEAYRATFRKHLLQAISDELPPSISAAIIYAHPHASLREVVRDAHRLLDDVAKEQACRDAFGVTVSKRAGDVLTFASKWDADGASESMPARLVGVYAAIKANDISRSYLYRLRDLLEVVDELKDAETTRALLAAEYLRSRARSAPQSPQGERAAMLTDAMMRVAMLEALKPTVGQTWDAIRFCAFLAEAEV